VSARVTIALLFVLGATQARAQTSVDPSAPGPLAVAQVDYDLGDSAAQLPDFAKPVEMVGRVFYPSALADGPYPLIVFLHGRHSTCFSGTQARAEWPCSAGNQSIPSYQGYDYMGQILASHGYVVVSIGANGINAADFDAEDGGMLGRAELVQQHLDLWARWNRGEPAPFMVDFSSKIDLSRIGTMGHSRGGEGVVGHYLYNLNHGAPYGIKAVLPLAPVDFNRNVPTQVPLGVILPYCDGDVSDLQGVHYYDDSLFAATADLAPKHVFLVMGANHNFFNTTWTPATFGAGATDDFPQGTPGGMGDPACGPAGRLTDAQQRAVGLAYLSAFFRAYVGGENEFLPLLRGDDGVPQSASPAVVRISYHAPDGMRLDIDRMLDQTSLATNTLGGAVSAAQFSTADMCGGAAPEPSQCIPGADAASVPHDAPSWKSGTPGLSQLHLAWNMPGALYRSELPAGARDLSAFQFLSFRAGVQFDLGNPSGVDLDCTVRVTDGAGVSGEVRASDLSSALKYPPGSAGGLPKSVLTDVRVPLELFSVDTTDLRTIELVFNQTPTGAVLISDLAATL
jgi:hypothetical protein